MKKILFVIIMFLCSLTCFTKHVEAAEKKSGKYRYEILDKKKKTIAVTYVSRVSSVVKIPKKLKGYTVVQLGTLRDNSYKFLMYSGKAKRIFSNKDVKKVKQINIPDTVYNIGMQAFKGCKNLKKLIFPKELRYIGAEAMYDCQKLTNIILPKKLKGIGCSAFCGCTALKKVQFKTNKAKIGKEAFLTSWWKYKEPSHLKYIILPTTYKGEIMDSAFAGYIGKTFTWKNFTADNGAFFDGVKTLKTINIHKKVTDVEIPRNCLDDCAKQLEIVVPKSVESVYIWQQRYNIKQVTIRGLDTVLEGDYAMGDGDKHNMITVETVKCSKKSLAWELASHYICPDFTEVDWEDFTDPDTMYKESNIDTKPVELIAL